MPLLKSQRYNSFESNPARDTYRGLPLQQFPWVLESFEFKSSREDLVWNLEISCLAASPSGFGAKLNFNLNARASLSSSSIAKSVFPLEPTSRIGMLFSNLPLSLEVSSVRVSEGTLEMLPKLAKEFGKEFQLFLTNEWPKEKVQENLQQRLRRSSPGGFGGQ